MSIMQMTPPEAYAALEREPEARYLDVRTHEEFEAGHPAGARNVPIIFFEPGTHRGLPNRDFVSRVRALFPPGTKLIVGCQAGGRSQHACEVLASEGYDDLVNVSGGFGGARDQTGKVVVPGWREAGLPVETGADED